MSGRELGDFLRARRGALTPDDVGLPGGEHRRVVGLRREEVALLSGVSVDYVKRIEQGQEPSPSVQVLDALARALRLDRHGLTYMNRLSGRRDPEGAIHSQVRPALRELLDAMGTVPALIVDPSMTVLAANPLGDALLAGFTATDNILKMIFLDPYAAEFYVDWEHAASGAVRNLRANVAEHPGHEGIAAILGLLMLHSPAFGEQWSRYEVQPRSLEDKVFHHAQVGDLHLRFQTFAVDEAPGQRLYVYAPARGGGSAQKLAMLDDLARSADPSGHREAHLPHRLEEES